MKRFVVAALLLFVCGIATAQTQTPTPAAEQPSFEEAPTTASDKIAGPSYSDINCAGFVTKEKYPASNAVVGDNATNVSRMGERETVFLGGTGYTVGSRYNVVRLLRDPNRYEIFPGQNSMLNRMGNLYSDMGRVRITKVEGKVAIAVVEFSCEALAIGDTVIPYIERPRPAYRTEKKTFERFVDFDGKQSGRIVMGRSFDEFIGTGHKVYINLGSNQGLQPGDYVRITRSYDSKSMPPVEKLSLDAPFTEDSQREPHPPKSTVGKTLPWRGLGEAMVLSTTPDTATAMVTFALEDIQPGDVVEKQSHK